MGRGSLGVMYINVGARGAKWAWRTNTTGTRLGEYHDVWGRVDLKEGKVPKAGLTFLVSTLKTKLNAQKVGTANQNECVFSMLLRVSELNTLI